MVSLVPTMMVVPPCPDPWFAATERGAALPVVSSGWPGGA